MEQFYDSICAKLCATPIVSSVIQKLLEMRQKDNETVLQYVSRYAENFT